MTTPTAIIPRTAWQPAQWPLTGQLYTRYHHWTGTDAGFARLAVWLEMSSNLRAEILRLGWIYRCPTCSSNALAAGIDDGNLLRRREDSEFLDSTLDNVPVLTQGRFSADYDYSEAFPQRHFGHWIGRGGRHPPGMRFREWTQVERKDDFSGSVYKTWRSSGRGGRKGRVMMRKREGPIEQRPVAMCSTCAIALPAMFAAEQEVTYTEVVESTSMEEYMVQKPPRSEI